MDRVLVYLKVNMRGLNLEKELREQDGTERKFGALSQPGLVSIPLLEREKYLPKGEDQNIGEEKFWCATASPLNALAALFTYHYQHDMQPDNKKWLKDNGYTQYDTVDFSDSFVAINSGTTREGNSLIAPLRAIRANGLVPKSRLPQLNGFDETYDPTRITQELKDLGAEFARRFTITYEQVSSVLFLDVLKDDFVGCALFAWPQPVNGVYSSDRTDFNHAIVLVTPDIDAFDNYEATQGDFLKRLARDYTVYPYGYRVILSAEDAGATKKKINLLLQLIALLKEEIAILLQKVGDIIKS